MPLGIQGAYSRLAIVLVLIFIGLPFVVRTVQPMLQDLEAEVEEAAACLGATRWQTFRRVILPTLLPAMVTGFALAFARGIGEYGSVVFVSGNMPFKTEIAPVLIVAALEEFQYREAAAIAVVLLMHVVLDADRDQSPRTLEQAPWQRLAPPRRRAAPKKIRPRCAGR